MDPVKIKCPKCQRTYKIEEKILGKKVTCATEGCGTKFVAELPAGNDSAAEIAAPSDQPATTEPPKATGVSITSAPPPVPIAPEPRASDDPFADLDLDSLHSLPSRRSSPKHDDDLDQDQFDAAPPPLPTRRTAPSAPIFLDDQPKKRSNSSAKVILAMLCVAIAGVSFWILLNFVVAKTRSARSSEMAKVDSELIKHPLVELLYRTDATLRLMRVSGDADLAHEAIDQWIKYRNMLPQSDETEVSFSVIEGHLKQIHETLYSKNSRSLRDSLRWPDARASVDSIRTAQTQLMHVAKIPWKVAQRTDLYESTFTLLRAEAREIAAAGELGKDNLPAALSPNERRATCRKLDLLYAQVPQQLDALVIRRIGRVALDDEFTIPGWLTLDESDSDAWNMRLSAAELLEKRTQIPTAQDTLKGKTDVLKFSQYYKTTLDLLKMLTK